MSTYTPQHLTLEGVKEAARNAYDKGELGAQRGYECLYAFDDESKCAIGAALDEATLAHIMLNSMNGNDVLQLMQGNVITCTPDETPEICRIQELHDEATGGPVPMENFLHAIDHPSVIKQEVAA